MSSMLWTQLPCSHLYYFDHRFPELQPPKLQFINVTKGDLIFEYKIFKLEKKEITVDYYSKVRNYVYKTIKPYSHSKEKKQIQVFVENKLPFAQVPNDFVLGYPAEIYKVIDEGISNFKNKKEIK